LKHSYHIRDPGLTPLGKKQCLTLRTSFPYHDDIDIVLASPMKRTIETALIGFAPALAKPDVSFLLVPHAQEISAYPCDVGSERGDLEGKLEAALAEAGFTKNRLDFTNLEPQWTVKVRYRGV
jgi:broad specificity phosphatase PhoE